jgi:hypothetical protein
VSQFAASLANSLASEGKDLHPGSATIVSEFSAHGWLAPLLLGPWQVKYIMEEEHCREKLFTS